MPGKRTSSNKTMRKSNKTMRKSKKCGLYKKRSKLTKRCRCRKVCKQ